MTKKVLVSMWVYEEDRDFIKVEAAKKGILMHDYLRSRLPKIIED